MSNIGRVRILRFLEHRKLYLQCQGKAFVEGQRAPDGAGQINAGVFDSLLTPNPSVPIRVVAQNKNTPILRVHRV